MSKKVDIKLYVIDLLTRSQKTVYKLYKFSHPETKGDPTNKDLEKFRNSLIHSIKKNEGEATQLFPIIKYVNDKYLTQEDQDYDSVLFTAPMDDKIAIASPIEVLDSPLKKGQYDLKIEWDFFDVEERESILYSAFYNYYQLIKNDKNIKDFVEKIGMDYINFLDLSQRENDFFAPDVPQEVFALHQSDNLNSLLPTEVALLKDPDLEVMFYKNFIEKKLLSYQLWGIEREISENIDYSKLRIEKMSPLVICLDTSGSMRGITEVVSKGITLAIIKILEENNIPFVLCMFSMKAKFIDFKKSYADKDIFKITLGHLRSSYYGGTDFDNFIYQLYKNLESRTINFSNVLIISDFTFKNLSENTMTLIKKMKKQLIGFHGLNISEKNFDNKNLFDLFKTYWSYSYIWNGVPYQKESLIYELSNINFNDKDSLENIHTFGILKNIKGKENKVDVDAILKANEEKLKHFQNKVNNTESNAGNNILKNM